jgi:ABC-type sugar transport system substrate-binding protein
MVAERASAARCYVDGRRTIATNAQQGDRQRKFQNEREAAMIGSAARAYRLAVFTKNWSNPAYAGARLGADRLARRLGCRLTHFVPTRPDDVAEQRALLETALAERPDAILLAPTHATALNDVLSGLQALGIPLLLFHQPTAWRRTCVFCRRR